MATQKQNLDELAKKYGGKKVTDPKQLSELAKKYGGTVKTSPSSTPAPSLSDRSGIATPPPTEKKGLLRTIGGKLGSAALGPLGKDAREGIYKVGKFLTGAEQGLAKNAAAIFGTQQLTPEQAAEFNKQANQLIMMAKKHPEGSARRTQLLEQAKQTSRIAAGMADDTMENLPTSKEVIGNVAGVGLDLVTAGTYGNAAKGLKAGQLATKAPTAISKVAQGVDKGQGFIRGAYQGAKASAKVGAPIGAAYGAVAGLQSNQDLGGIAKSAGLGALTGGAIGGALGGLGGGISGRSLAKRTQLAIDKRAAELSKLESGNAPLRRTIAAAKAKGIDVKNIVAQTDLLQDAVDKTGTIRTTQEGGAVAQLNDFIKPQEDVITNLIEKEGSTISLKEIESKLKRAVMDSGVQGGALTRALKNVEDDIAGYAIKADKQGNVPLSLVHSAKVDKYANINYLNPESKRVDKVIAKKLKEIVEEKSSANVKALNAELARHYAVLGFLEKLDGKKVAGGKLGKYFAQTIGAVVGSHFGPLGAIAGAETGGQIRGAMMANKFRSGLGSKLEQSQMMKEAIELGNKPKAPPLQLGMGTGGPRQQVNVPIKLGGPTTYEAPAKSINYSNSLGSRNMSQSTTMAPTTKVIKPSISQSQSAVKGISKDLPKTEIKVDGSGGYDRLKFDAYIDSIEGKSIPLTHETSIENARSMLKNSELEDIFASLGFRDKQHFGVGDNSVRILFEVPKDSIRFSFADQKKLGQKYAISLDTMDHATTPFTGNEGHVSIPFYAEWIKDIIDSKGNSILKKLK